MGLSERAETKVHAVDVSPMKSASCLVYTNCGHEFDEDVATRLEQEPGLFVGHAAWEYWGVIWKPSQGLYREQVHRHGWVVAEYESDNLRALVEHVIEEHGDE